MKFYLDEDLSHRIAELMRARDVDAISSHECGQNGAADALQMEFAASQERCLVTRNRDDFTELTIPAFESGTPHYGVLIVPGSIDARQFKVIAERLLVYAKEFPDGLPQYTIDYLKP
ncbi:MAG: hypothetical protein FJX76_25265 [Armatimonadetes bacterium]|nr:hypothetical protein [Armatimonadota bacterium]